MRLADENKIKPDYYSNDGVVKELESKFATLLGHESPHFLPACTLANHMAVPKIGGENRRVVVQELSHFYNDSGDCAQTLSKLNLIPLGQGSVEIKPEELDYLIKKTKSGRVELKIGVLSIETPVRRLQDRLYTDENLKPILSMAKENGIKLHLDGARLFVQSAHTNISPAEYGRQFDTVYTSLTAGRVILYNKIGNRTAFLCLIAQGARFQGDTGCSKVGKVTFAGFDIPEFASNGTRNWKFHKGYQSNHPVYRRVTMSNAGDKVNDVGHPLLNDHKVALHKRGEAMTIPALTVHRQYYVVNKTANDYQVSLTQGGAPIEFAADSVGTEIFAYRAHDAGLFDVDQGKPEFFPNIGFTFSGTAYIEILVPTELSNGEDEPTRTKMVCRGKEVYQFELAVDGYLDTVGDPVDLECPALIAYDMLKNDLLAPRERFNGQSWVDWKERSAETITWVGGNENPAIPESFPVMDADMTYDNTIGRINNNGAGHNIAASIAIPATERRNMSIEGVYRGGDIYMRFGTGTNELSATHILSTDGSTLFYSSNCKGWPQMRAQ